jgi:hypothetical protein
VSNALAIAATTSTLRNLLLTQIPPLDVDLSDLEVTAQPPDQARKGITTAQINLFLYQTAFNGAWRNQNMPGRVRPGETGVPPLAINLHYLVTAFGRGESDNDVVSHRALGGALSVLHDHPVLSRNEIRIALANNDLADQFERLKITPLPMGLEEMSKLWMTFQTQYRISAAYEVAVVLIDSRTPVKSALPVLMRGPNDRGVTTITGRATILTEIRPPRSQPGARLGEDIAILGEQLSISETTVRFTHLRLDQPVELPPRVGASVLEIVVHLPDKGEDSDALKRWTPGFYSVVLVNRRAGVSISSNAIAFTLAPRITVSPNSSPPGTVDLTVTCEPRILDGQRLLLLFGDRQVDWTSVSTPADVTQPTTLTFTVTDVVAGSYVVRLRVDGVDSIPVVYSGTPTVPVFDPTQQVVVA